MYLYTVYCHGYEKFLIEIILLCAKVYFNPIKYFKCICILCIVMDMKSFLIEIILLCAKVYFNPIKANIKPTLLFSYWPWNLNLASYLFCFLQLISNPFDLSWPIVHIILAKFSFVLCYFYLDWYINSFICIFLIYIYIIICEISAFSEKYGSITS